MSYVLDASAVLAIIFDEPGAERALEHARGALISTVNLVEVFEKAEARKIEPGDLRAQLRRLEIQIVDFGEREALIAAGLRPSARRVGVSLADVACLALAANSEREVVTADRDWQKLDHEIPIVLIR